MVTSFKKLLLVAITLLLGVMSGGVMAQATYSFEFIGDYWGSASGVFTVNDSTQVITNITGIVSNRLVGSDPMAGSGYIWANDNQFYPSGGAPPFYDYRVLNDSGIGFQTDKYLFNLSGASGGYSLQSYKIGYTGDAAYDYFSAGGGGTSGTSTGSMTVTPLSGSAPEIDGSLAPKVGFLLGCLFLMFGRKKQNTESMLST